MVKHQKAAAMPLKHATDSERGRLALYHELREVKKEYSDISIILPSAKVQVHSIDEVQSLIEEEVRMLNREIDEGHAYGDGFGRYSRAGSIKELIKQRYHFVDNCVTDEELCRIIEDIW